MEITSYKKLSSNLYEVTIDKNMKIKLYDEIILKHDLLIDKEIDNKRLDKILKDNEPLDGYYKALKYYSKRMRTKKELREYLKKYELDEKSISYALDRMEKEGYLDDKKYVEAFVLDALNLSLDGPKKIEIALSKLGISSRISLLRLEKIEREVWVDRINTVIKKKYKVNKVGLALFKNKIYNELIKLGYNSDMIKECLDSYSFEDNGQFQKEAEKAFRVLSNKYSDKELVYKFKAKMYAKGFSPDEINNFLEKEDYFE